MYKDTFQTNNYDFAWRFQLNENGSHQIENGFMISSEKHLFKLTTRVTTMFSSAYAPALYENCDKGLRLDMVLARSDP